MRTTLNVDDEIHELLRRRAREQRISFTEVVNRALRDGLAPRTDQPEVTWPTHALGATLTPSEVKDALRATEPRPDPGSR